MRCVTLLLLAALALAARADDFRHPGILLNRAQLDLLKQRVAAGTEPQKTAFAALLASPLAALDYAPSPRAKVECGSNSRPDLGCKDERRDATAAYSQALAWCLTGQERYARNAIRIMNAWSGTLTGGHTLANGPIQAAWSASVWPRAAELIRHTSVFWAPEDIARFEKMLREQYVPSIIGGSVENGNKELAMAEALINVGVFCSDRALYEAGVKMWRARTPAYIYLASDGPQPVAPPNGTRDTARWTNKGKGTALVDGLLQESMRDPHHANMGFASIVNAAETARQQGLDLYAEAGRRITAAMEFQAQFLVPNAAKPPPDLEMALQPTWEIAYNHFHHRLGQSLPRMARVLPTNRPTGADLNHMVWETLTHGDVGAAGVDRR
ncbi:MAG: alginate lyase family protein [Verrucomicrobia bacterium]|nr:alginate lyase family protein [Verrucomicrobiota bacterium]